MIPLIAAALPTIVQGLASTVPAVVEATVAWVAEKFGLSEKSVEAVQNKLNGLSSQDIIKLKELDYEYQKFIKENGLKLDLAQIGVNEKEAQSNFLFVAGWRPYIGWIGGTGIGYQFLVRPLLNGIAHLCGVVGNPFDTLEIQDLIALVATMLGSSAMRSWDKKNGNGNGN
jgi:hypothetical protein